MEAKQDTTLSTAMLNQHGFSMYNRREDLIAYFARSFRIPETTPYEHLEPENKKKIDHYYNPLDKHKELTDILVAKIQKRKGVWMFVAISDFDVSWQEFIKQMGWEKRVMFRSIPTRNYNYQTPNRHLILYVMDFRDAYYFSWCRS